MEIFEREGAIVVTLERSYSAFDEDLLDETQEELLALVDRQPIPFLILDFTQTEYFSSVFFEILFRVWKRIKERGGQFRLCSLQPSCQEIFEMAKLDSLWTIYPNVSNALEADA